MNFKTYFHHSVTCLLFFLFVNLGYSQDNNPWVQKPIPSNIATSNGSVIGFYTLDLNKLKTILATSSEVKFPFTDGSLALFKVTKKSVLSPDLQAKYPGIGTYSGAIGGSSKIDFTVNSFGVLGKVKLEDKVYTLKSVGGSNYILTYIQSDTTPVDDDDQVNQSSSSASASRLNSSSTTANLGAPSSNTSLKVYRLAVLPTAEYSNHFIDLYGAGDATLAEKKEIVMSAIAQTISTVNSVTVRDLGIKFELALSNDKLIEFNTANDKLTHGDKMALLGEASKVINSKIGINSYDLGHVFDASSFGGVANLFVLCNSNKANGISGSANPEVGDYFPGVVAHEIGHQLGAWHTFNSNVGTGTNRVETGAGITIMGYGNMELFYHAKSIKEMNAYITNTSCAVIRSNSNTAPTYLTSPLSTVYTIPAGTPFVLGDKFSFKDAQNDILSYNWDQMDAVATSNPPLATSNVGPSFITYYPKDELVRFFPKLETVLSGSTASTWEVIPQVSREMNFTLNVRESNFTAPILVQEDFKVTTLNNGSGPFIVTSQGVSGTKYKQGDEVMINWNESSSKASAINTQNVKISLSYDGGLTFSYVLAETTPNDGSEKVTLPILANTTSARIKVEPVGNIYYAINKANFEITNPPFAFNMNTPSLVRCYGEQESKITIDPSGGGGAPYSISWFKNNSTSFQPVVDADSDPKSLIDLGVGLYKVRVTDKDGIVYEQEVTIGGPTNPLVVSNVVNNTKPVLCFGDNTGQIGLQASGGSAPYKYILNGTEVASNRGDRTLDTDSYLISNLTAGSYTIKIIDANNCASEQISVVINGPSSPLSISNSVITNTTLSNSNGAISITIAGGTAPYTYSWSGPNSYTSANQNISTLANGLYKLRVTDAKGCTLESNFTIESEDTFNYNIAQSNVSCKGGTNGSLSTFPSGGNGGPYQVAWTGPNGFSSTNFSINNLVAGVYELRIKDKLGASFDLKTVTITEPQNALAITSSFLNNVDCTGDSTGSYGLNIAGGTSPYTYSVNGIVNKTSGISGTNSDVFTQENLSAGTYVVNVKDNSGCTANYQSVITQPLTRVDIISFTVSPITVTDAVDGAIAIEVAGGTSPYTYSWTGPNSYTSSSKNISGLRSGTYRIVVKDANNCLSIPRDFVLANPTPFVFNITTVNTSCFGSALGSITANPQGGYGGPYRINWFKYNGTSYLPTNDGILDGNDLVLSKIGAGLYKIVVTDSKGIIYSQDGISITEPAQMNLQLVANSIQSETCFELKNGAFSVSIAGGTDPYTYILNDVNKLTNSNATQAITGLGFGDYVLTIKDMKGCYSNSLAVYIPGPEEIKITNMAEAITQIKCYNTSDGAIAINVKGGANNGYTFSWTGPSNFTSTNEDLTGLSNPGTYTVRITDRTYTSCFKDFEFVLEKPTELQATVSSISNNVCFDPPYAGGFSIAITGGTLPYKVNGDLFNSGSVSFSEKGTGTYTVTVNDINNCKAITLSPQVLGPSSAMVISNKVAVNNVCDPAIQDPANASLSFDLNAGTPFNDAPGSGYFYKVTLKGEKAGTIVLPTNKFYIDPTSQKASVRFENLKDDVYTVTIIQKDPNNLIAQNNGCEIEFVYKLSKSIYFLEKTVQNVLCASANASGKLELKGIYGGKPFIDLSNKKYYKYQILNANGSQLGTDQQVFQGGDLGLADPSVPTIVISNLPQGLYSIQFIDDGSGCDVLNKVPFEIFKPAPHTIQLISKKESCNAESNGTATVKITGGVAPYRISIVDATNTNNAQSTSLWFGVFGEEDLGASEIMTGLAAGTYKIKLTDSNQCETISTDSFTVDEFDAFTHSRVITPESCFETNDGKVVYTINGGAQPLVVELSKGSESYLIDEFYSDNGNGGNLEFDNLSPGIYTITIKDQNSQCIDFSEEVIIPGPSQVVISAVDADIKNISCFDKTDGSIKIDVTGGGYTGNMPTYIYVWKKNGVVITNPSNPKILTNLGEGIYNISVTPVLGGIPKTDCTVEQTYSITKPEPLYLIEEVNQHIDVFCNGGTDGFYKIYFTGGTAPYSVLSGLGNNPLSEIASNIDEDNFSKSDLAAGIYKIDIKDANGCKFSEGIKTGVVTNGTVQIEIKQPAAKLLFREIVTPVSCKENTATNDGTIQVEVTGGTAPYKVTWTGPTGFTEIINKPLEGIFKITGPAGSYTYTVTDAVNNCGANPGGNPVIKEPAQLTITEVSKSNATEFRKADGKYKFSLAGNSGDTTFTNYETTTKWYKIVNNVEVEQTQYTNGTLEAIDLGVGSYRIRSIAKHKSVITTTTYDGATTTVVTAPSNFIECATYKDFEITQPILLSVSEVVASHLDVKCNGASTGSITLNITGGTAPYEVRWTKGSTTLIRQNVGSSVTIDQLAAGDYSIEVIDAKGYRYSQTKNPVNNDIVYGLIPVRITQPASSLQITTNLLHETCRESNDGSIEVIVSGGTAPYSITWDQSPVAGYSYLTNDTNGVFKIKGGAGLYHYLVKDKFEECGTTPGAAIEIKEPELLEIQEQLKANVTEFRKPDGKYTISLVGVTDSGPFVDVNAQSRNTFNDYATNYSTTWYRINAGLEEALSYSNNTFAVTNLVAGSYRIKTTSSHKSIGTTTVYNGSTTTTYTISASVGCATSKDFIITEPELLKVTEDSAARIDVKCNGNNTGSITLNIVGGTAPYEVRWSKGSITDFKPNVFNSITIDQLAAGDYTIDVIDAKGYRYSQTKNPVNNDIVYGLIPVRITQPASSLQITTNLLHETCKESNDGSIEVIVSGGTAPYSITWDQSPEAGFSYLTNDTNGVFKIKGGSGMYHYLVKDKFDECGTIPGAAIEIKEPEVLEIQEQLKANATEFRKADGKYRVGLVGITDSSPFTNVNTNTESKAFYDFVYITNWYKISEGTEVPIVSLANTFESSTLGAGTYRIRTASSHKSRGTKIVYNSTTNSAITSYPITSSIDCSVVKEFVITEPELLKVTEETASHVNVKCYGANTGSITLNIIGGTAPYKVLINNLPKDVEGNSITIDQLTAGNYSIEVIDFKDNRYSVTRNPANGDVLFGLLPIEITQPTIDRKLFIDRTKVTLTNTSCGLNNGKIVLTIPATVVDGPEPDKVLNYFWTGPEGWTSNSRNIENLAPGNYNLTIVDQNSCSITTSPFIILPSVEVKFDAPEYVILNCKTPADPAVISITNITGTEVNGQKIEWFKYNESSGLYDPYIDLTASDERVRSVTSIGKYKVRVSTLNPICFAEKIINVIEKGFNLNDKWGRRENYVYKDEYQKPSCFNGKGSFEFQIEKVEPNASKAIEFYLDNVAITLESDNLIKYGDESPERKGFKLINVPIGSHVLKVKDEFGCESILNFEIENRAEIRLKSILLDEYIVQKIKCLDEFGTNTLNKAVIDVTNQVTGGVGVYRFRWTGPSNFSSPNARIEVAKPGTYDLVIIDENNCESKTYSFTITAPEAIVITEAFHKNQSCIDEKGSLGVSISGGTAPYTIEWKNEKDEVISTLFELSNLPLGSVSAIVTDSNGCSSGKQEFKIIDERLTIPINPIPDESVCVGKPGYIEAIITKNNSSTLKFYYNNVEVSALKDTAEYFRIVIDNPVLGAELKIENSFGCSLSYTYQFGIAEPKLEILNADGKIMDMKDRSAENEEVVFKNKSVGTYIREVLDFGDGTPPIEILRSETSLEKRKHTYTASGVYTSKMEIFNELGCSVTIKRPVFVGKAYQLKFPTSFSPNLRSDGVPEGDDVNDYFRPIFNGFKSGKMTIYDSAGVKLYEESFSNPDFKDTTELTSWKGWNGQNASLSNRNYYCIFEGVTFEDIVINKSANFYLFK